MSLLAFLLLKAHIIAQPHYYLSLDKMRKLKSLLLDLKREREIKKSFLLIAPKIIGHFDIYIII